MPKRLAIFFLFYAFSQFAKAQAIGDTSINGKLTNVVDFYISTLGDQSPLYNGKEYVDYAFLFREGHPFFESREFVKGQIQYEEMTFRQVPMLYDLVKDQVIIYDIRNIYKVVLPANKIRQFVLAGHTFVRIEHNRMKTGFYDQLYKGKISLYARREKKLTEERDSYRIDNIIQSKTTYFILKEGVYHSFKNKNGLLDILKDTKKDLQQYLKKNKIRYKDNPEKAMMMAVEYCNR